MPPPVLEVPRAELPSYKPLVVPPNTLRPPPGIEGVNTEDKPPEKEKPTAPIKQPIKPNINLPPSRDSVYGY
jgi:hypothetical protein